MLKIHIARKPMPRMPPVEDVNNADIMLGRILLALVVLCVVGIVIWAVKYH